MKKTFLISIMMVALLMPVLGVVAAQALVLSNSATKLEDVGKLTKMEKSLSFGIGNVGNMVLALVGTIFFGLTVYAGIRWMTAQGNDEHIKKAQNTLIAAVVGLIITMMAYAITAFVTSRVGAL
ncbi:MAG: hypothetical protein A2538_02370 [Candidatus Magasanikbacteria bacterium RIFOXYD2_FULL_41_14]|uniref:Uncharacterized protein n=1 Tax=Candidatus Magasanikbacteria bacterium RIFOXYD2_FULL_41_14 TaxID=1798709 RepID=A0A1F6PC30_9BACT|nr:MAG: hypothetical protein A2538_02370 [Candidatus Magasanikbacteria bacterium RIFOXYD2_FULL_41_14]